MFNPVHVFQNSINSERYCTVYRGKRGFSKTQSTQKDTAQSIEARFQSVSLYQQTIVYFCL